MISVNLLINPDITVIISTFCSRTTFEAQRHKTKGRRVYNYEF